MIHYPVKEAIKLAQEASVSVSFNPEKKGKDVMNVQFKLGVDPQRSDQGVRGSCLMPGGLGKEIRLAVFTNKELEA